MVRTAPQEPGDWIDGFLFVANGPTELLPDFHALERWLIAAGIVSSAKTKTLLRSWRDSPAAASFLKELVAFRERLREAILRIEAGSAPAVAFRKGVHARLGQHRGPSPLSKPKDQMVREG